MDGTAIYYALSIEQITTPIGAYLYQFPTLLTVLTFATLGLEALGPLLLFSPILTGPVRTGAVLAFMSLHFGILLTLYIGIFPWVAALCMVCFLPSWFWEKASAGRPSAEDAATQDEPGSHAEHATALPETSGPAPLRSLLLTNLLALFFLLYVFCWNLTTVSEYRMPERLVPIGYALGLAQVWDMFAPYPIRDVGWHVVPGTLHNGQQVDLMSVTRDDFGVHEGVSWEKPQDVPGAYKNDRWRTYLERARLSGDSVQFLHFGRYLCREWNARHAGAERLEDFQITYILETTLPDYQRAAPRKVILWEHRC